MFELTEGRGIDDSLANPYGIIMKPSFTSLFAVCSLDLVHSIFLYGPPCWQIAYNYSF